MTEKENRKATPQDDWPEKFLSAYRTCGIVSRAAKRARVTRAAVYARRDADKEFAAAFADAREEATDLLEEEARRRAVTGTLRPAFYKGDECGKIREYSDTLLVLLLKANRPEKFQPAQRMEHTGSGGGPVVIREVVVNLSQHEDE